MRRLEAELLPMTFVDSGKDSRERQRGGKKENGDHVTSMVWQTAVQHVPLCQDIFFYTLNDDTHQSQPDSGIRTGCKHAKPSSLKYADN